MRQWTALDTQTHISFKNAVGKTADNSDKLTWNNATTVLPIRAFIRLIVRTWTIEWPFFSLYNSSYHVNNHRWMHDDHAINNDYFFFIQRQIWYHVKHCLRNKLMNKWPSCFQWPFPVISNKIIHKYTVVMWLITIVEMFNYHVLSPTRYHYDIFDIQFTCIHSEIRLK